MFHNNSPKNIIVIELKAIQRYKKSVDTITAATEKQKKSEIFRISLANII